MPLVTTADQFMVGSRALLSLFLHTWAEEEMLPALSLSLIHSSSGLQTPAWGRRGLCVHEYTLGTNPLWVQGFPVLQWKLGVTFCLIIPGQRSRAQARKPCAQVTSVDFSELCKYLFLCLFWEQEHL